MPNATQQISAQTKMFRITTGHKSTNQQNLSNIIYTNTPIEQISPSSRPVDRDGGSAQAKLLILPYQEKNLDV
jgi:hypothetical protein